MRDSRSILGRKLPWLGLGYFMKKAQGHAIGVGAPWLLAGLVLAVPPLSIAQEIDPPPVVVLLHPSIKHWAKAVEELSLPVGVQLANGNYLPYQVRVGAAATQLKDARFVFHIGAPFPLFNKSPFKGTVTTLWHVPYALLFRESNKAKFTELCKGVHKERQANQQPTGESFVKAFPGPDRFAVFPLPQFSRTLASKLIDPTRMKEVTDLLKNDPITLLPADTVETKDGKVVAIKLDNRWPFGVGIRIIGLYETFPADRYFSLRNVRDKRGDLHDHSIRINLTAREKLTVTIPATAVKDAKIRWATAILTISDNSAAPIK